MQSKNGLASAPGVAAPSVNCRPSGAAEQSTSTATVETKIVTALPARVATMLSHRESVAPPTMVVPLVAAAGEVTVLSAPPFSNMLALATYLASVVSGGWELWGQTVERGRVLWVGLEEEPGDDVRRSLATGAHPDNVVIVTRINPRAPVERLEDEITKHQPRLVIIDSLAGFVRGVDDQYSEGAWTKALIPLTQLARGSRAAIVVLDHAMRRPGLYRCASAICAATDMIIEMSESTDDASVRVMKPRGRRSIAPYTIRYVCEPAAEWLLVDGGGSGVARARNT